MSKELDELVIKFAELYTERANASPTNSIDLSDHHDVKEVFNAVTKAVSFFADLKDVLFPRLFRRGLLGFSHLATGFSIAGTLRRTRRRGTPP